MKVFVIAFCLSVSSIFFKGMSQQNMQFRRKALILPTSIALSIMEMFTAGLFVSSFLSSSLAHSVFLALVIGCGGALGAVLSLDFHSWLTKKLKMW